nr:acetyl ornithine aminotransferase family protein [Candidatus Njordarchaeota archaeon]
MSEEEIPKIVTPIPGPNAKRIVEADSKFIVKSTKTGPVVAKRAYGVVVEDVDGNKLLDFTVGISVCNIGYCHPKVTEAIKTQADKLVHYAGQDWYYEEQVSLARKLTEITPGTFPKQVFFSNSGTESNEAAIKLAKYHQKRPQFISFIGAFHGRSIGSVSLTASKPVHKEGFFPLMPGVSHVPYAYCYRCAYKMTYPSCGLWCVKYIDEVLFNSYLPPTEVAAIFAEPIQGEGGYAVPPNDFFKEIKKICDKYGILLVDDEVQAGMGRTGKWFCTEHYDVTPDIITTSKAIASGIPLGATVVRADLVDWKEGSHSNTFGGNTLACVAALATIKVIESEKLLDRATRMGEKALRRLNEMKEKYEIVGDVRGKGLMIGIEFVKDKKTKERNPEAHDEIPLIAIKKGLVLLPVGKNGIRIIPPLNIEENVLDKGLEIFEDSVKEFAKKVPKKK